NGVDLLGFGKKKKASLSRRKEVRPRRNTHLKGKVKITRKEKTSVNNTNASSSEVCLTISDSK
ncbi:11147_t:CDS:1, partial [Gigaspora rosea]